MHTKKGMSINLSFNEKFPESARTWELGDQSLICLPCFIYWLVLKRRMHLHVQCKHTIKHSWPEDVMQYHFEPKPPTLFFLPNLPPHPSPNSLPQECNPVSLNLCFSNQNAPCVKVIRVFFQLLFCLLHLLWDILCRCLQQNKNTGHKYNTVKLVRQMFRGTGTSGCLSVTTTLQHIFNLH